MDVRWSTGPLVDLAIRRFVMFSSDPAGQRRGAAFSLYPALPPWPRRNGTRALHGAKFLDPLHSTPFGQIHIHPYPAFFGRKFPVSTHIHFLGREFPVSTHIRKLCKTCDFMLYV